MATMNTSFYLSVETLKMLKLLKEDDNRTMSYVIRALIEKEFERIQKERKRKREKK